MDNKQAIAELKCLREDYWDDDGYGHETKEYEDTMVALDMAIASLENERLKAYWIERFKKEDKWLECSNCHSDSDDAYNFRPNCGADMR